MKMNPYHDELLNKFNQEVLVVYRGESYHVRDNGSVLRRKRLGRRNRPLDQVWTFGSPNASTGYMNIGAHVVHRIVATAFHGEPPSVAHVVDHIDTNRRNNRADNLRWITRLENLLLNPITAHRIQLAYGSFDEFFKNPSGAKKSGKRSSFEWMRAVSQEEAQECLERLLKWSESGQIPNGGVLGEWLYGKRCPNGAVAEAGADVQSLTPSASQRNWRTPNEFEMCPDDISQAGLDEYAISLDFGTVFARNSFGASLTVIAEQGEDLISVVCRLPDNPVKKWAVCKVVVEGDKYVHEAIRTCFTLQGALKEHCSLMGTPLDQTIDDLT